MENIAKKSLFFIKGESNYRKYQIIFVSLQLINR